MYYVQTLGTKLTTDGYSRDTQKFVRMIRVKQQIVQNCHIFCSQKKKNCHIFLPKSHQNPSGFFSKLILFKNAKSIRLKSAHNKYLAAADDQVSVTQNRNGSSKSTKWTVEFVENYDTIIRLKSCYGKYLTASNQPFLLGMTGRKVIQTLPNRLDSSVEWEVMKQNGVVKLKTRYGQFLRANGGCPPWRNTVTHDIPHRTSAQDWEVHVVEILGAQPLVVVGKEDCASFASESSSPTTSFSSKSGSFSRQESNDSLVNSPSNSKDGRLIHFHVSDEYGEIEEGIEELSITFKGNNVQELTKRLEGALRIYGITVCTRSPLNGKLYPLRLHLPPNYATMHFVVVPPSSQENQNKFVRVITMPHVNSTSASSLCLFHHK
ncbi:hypothetical protein ACJIZ3_020217 [Penstemon smallii]|uniref:DUF569 domain-containing protein n=1 Tax=Penstemon smallii TaxID=265156 RepID=A0ABD3SIT5_9LAMI